ncbi:hypothetical protein MUK42_20515, partial [Musa troglodytarum]
LSRATPPSPPPPLSALPYRLCATSSTSDSLVAVPCHLCNTSRIEAGNEGTNNEGNGPSPLHWHPRRPLLFYLCCTSGKGGGQGYCPRGRALHRSEVEGWAMRDEEKGEGWGRRKRGGGSGEDDAPYDGSRRQQATSLTVAKAETTTIEGCSGGEGALSPNWRKKMPPKGKNKFGGGLVKAQQWVILIFQKWH